MKTILLGLLASLVFGVAVLFVLVPIASLVFSGDPFTLSFHLFTYMGLIALCGVVVSCTLVLVKKCDAILDKLSDQDLKSGK